jgi:GTP diphosphokinase / guanosine-3',5'-bis(diphosphate) 3'-diphosphatase
MNSNEQNENLTTFKTFADVIEVYFTYISNADDRQLIQKAYEFAELKHKGVNRKSGEPYIVHLIEVAYILAKLQAGPNTLAAGLLHDVVEDTDVKVEEIKKLFNDDVALLVESLTKIQKLKLSHRANADLLVEDHRKIFIGMARDIRVIIIKLADRLHNMRTLFALSAHRQKALARETLDLFVPIAHRLGMFTIKSELEDICLKYLEPQKYERIIKLLDQKSKFRKKSIDDIKKRIADIIFDDKIPFEIESRVKSIYSIYRKLYIENHNFDEIYDILAIRIITDTVLHCYELLGLVHATYKPIPGRFKDYIAMPKPNLYQSLHTTIVSGDGQIYEIQIRTKEMDEIAETGVAAHWRYKEGRGYNPQKEQKEIEEKLFWFRDFINITDDTGDAREVMENISKDIFDANVYVFTPKGKVIDLPTGSTPLDFAYRIHTDVGNSAIGATVNGALVALNTILKTGDIVEVKTSKNSSGPNEGWLKIVRTSTAKSNIRKFLIKKTNELLKDEKIAKGKTSCIDAFKDRGVDEKQMMELISQPKVLQHFRFANVDDLLIGVCNRNPQPSAIIDFLEIKKEYVVSLAKKKTETTSKSPVHVPNAGKVAIVLGSCCTPIPGDDIVGFITRGKGITVHRINCPNIQKEKYRLTEVIWNEQLALETYPVDIAIDSVDRNNLLIDVMNVFSQNKVAVTAINARLHTLTNNTTITATIYVTDAKRLNDIFNVLLNVTGVFKVTRTIH